MAKHTGLLRFRLEPELQKEIEAKAKSLNISVSDYLRDLAYRDLHGKRGKSIPHTRVGKEEIAVKDLLATPVFMKTEEKK